MSHFTRLSLLRHNDLAVSRNSGQQGQHIEQAMFLRTPVLRPSSSSGSSSSSQPPLTREIALPRFMHEREILTVQLQEWSVWLAFYRLCYLCSCNAAWLVSFFSEALQKTLLEVRKKRKAGQNTLQAHAEVAEGFFVKTQIDDTESFVVSLGLQDAYVELELEEAIAYSQRREQYLRV